MTQTFTPTLSTPPDSICLLRLSALGDISHVLPTLRTLQKHWPDTKITWLIGKTEYQLVKEINDVEFILFDKSAGLKGYFALRKKMRGKHFDILMHMQLSLRASMVSVFIPAKIKLGFDKDRAKDLQSFFCKQQINPLSTRQHVVDSFLEFPRHFGLAPVLRWDLPVNTTALNTIKKRINSDKPLLVINACALAKSKNWRNWTVDGYAQVADYAQSELGMQVILSGGNNPLESDIANRICQQCTLPPQSFVASTSLEEMVALLHHANVVIAPDTGPVHIASALGTPTIGLYATTNPLRAGPYNYQQYVVNKYPEALQQYYQCDVANAPWGARVKTAEAMALITVHDVTAQLEAIIKQTTIHNAQKENN